MEVAAAWGKMQNAIEDPGLACLNSKAPTHISWFVSSNKSGSQFCGQSAVTPISAIIRVKTFTGLVSGQQVGVAIGYQDEKGKFYVFWVGIIRVN